MAASNERAPELLGYRYSLEIDGIQVGVFDKISGGDREIEVIRHKVVYESGEYATLDIPGPTKTDPITLESGYGNTKELEAWFNQVVSGDIFGARKNATISLNAFVKGKYEPVIQWHLINVWPTKLSGVDFGQKETDRARFSITLVCESIEREDA